MKDFIDKGMIRANLTLTHDSTTTNITSANILDGSFSLNRYTTSAVSLEFGNVSSAELKFSVDTTTLDLAVARGDLIDGELFCSTDIVTATFTGTGGNEYTLPKQVSGFPISPIPDYMVVTVDGEEKTILEDYDLNIVMSPSGTTHRLVFKGGSIPPTGSSIVVVYKAQGSTITNTQDIGSFIVTDVVKGTNRLEITALDRMITLDGEADFSDLVFPMTAEDFLAVYEDFGFNIVVAPDVDITTIQLSDPVFEVGTTYRQALSKICEALGTGAYLLGSDLHIGWYDTYQQSDYVDEAVYTDATLTENGFGIEVEVTNELTAIPCEVKDDTIYLRIVANPFLANLTAEQRTTWAGAIKQRIGGVEYYGGDITTLPMPDVLPYFSFTVEKGEDSFLFPVTQITYGINENTKMEAKISSDDNGYNFGMQRDIQSLKGAVAESEKTSKHFFYRDDSGVHMTMVENDFNTGNNVLMDSNNINFRSGETTMASFGLEGSIIGIPLGQHLDVTRQGFFGYNDNGDKYFEVDFDTNPQTLPFSRHVQEEHEFNGITWVSPETNVFEHTPDGSYISLPYGTEINVSLSSPQLIGMRVWVFDSNYTGEYRVTEKAHVDWHRVVPETGGVMVDVDSDFSASFTVGTDCISPEVNFLVEFLDGDSVLFSLDCYFWYEYSAVGKSFKIRSRYVASGSNQKIDTVKELPSTNLVGEYIRSMPSFTFGTRSFGDKKGDFSATFGKGLIASSEQFVIGYWNEERSFSTLFMVGAGSFVTRKTVFEVDYVGNVKSTGDITDGYGNTLSNIQLDVPYNGGSPDNLVTALPHNTWTVLGSITLEEGTYILMITARFNANANGYRGIFLATNDSPDSSGGLQVATTDYRTAVNGTFTFCSFTSTRTVTGRTTYYLKAIQTSGSQLTVAPRVSVVRVA